MTVLLVLLTAFLVGGVVGALVHASRPTIKPVVTTTDGAPVEVFLLWDLSPDDSGQPQPPLLVDVFASGEIAAKHAKGYEVNNIQPYLVVTR